MKKTTPNQVFNEELEMRWLRRYSDWVVKKLKTENFTETEAVEFLEQVKQEILKRFPNKEYQYDIIYGRRFCRILTKRGIYLNIPPGEKKKTYN